MWALHLIKQCNTESKKINTKKTKKNPFTLTFWLKHAPLGEINCSSGICKTDGKSDSEQENKKNEIERHWCCLILFRAEGKCRVIISVNSLWVRHLSQTQSFDPLFVFVIISFSCHENKSLLRRITRHNIRSRQIACWQADSLNYFIDT